MLTGKSHAFFVINDIIISRGPATKKLKQGGSNGVWGYLLFSKYAVSSQFFQEKASSFEMPSSDVKSQKVLAYASYKVERGLGSYNTGGLPAI